MVWHLLRLSDTAHRPAGLHRSFTYTTIQQSAGAAGSEQRSDSSTCACPTTSERAGSTTRSQLSIMELVNQAAKQAELEAAAMAAAKRSGKRLGQGSPHLSLAAAHAQKSTRSPKAQQSRIAPAVACSSPRPAAAGTVASYAGSSRDASPRGAAQQAIVSAFDQHSKLTLLVPPSQFSQGSDCGSDDPLSVASTSSLCSSSSSSSLCSAASCGSNASTLSAASRPKSILLTRSSTSSISSSASSPRFSKRVTWKDGQADQQAVGQELVAVRLLEDTPEMRAVRKDTWPERPGARRDTEAQEQQAAAAVKDQQHHDRPGAAAGLVNKLLEPARLLDWRDKLRLLQLERRQQRMEQVQAGWSKAQPNKQPRSGSQQEQQMQQQHGNQQQQAEQLKPAAGSCGSGPIHISAVAAASVQAAGC